MNQGMVQRRHRRYEVHENHGGVEAADAMQSCVSGVCAPDGSCSLITQNTAAPLYRDVSTSFWQYGMHDGASFTNSLPVGKAKSFCMSTQMTATEAPPIGN